MISFVEIRSSKTLRRMKNYLLLELETTGPDPELDSIIELGMLRVSDGQIANRASTRINPETPIPPEVTESTGISNADVAGALSYAQIAPSIARLLLGEVVVAGRVQLEFIRTLLEECEFSGEIRTVDLERFAKKLLPELPGHDLDSLSAYFEIPAQEEGPRVLRDCARRYEVLQGCRVLWEEQAAAREEAERGGSRRGLFAGVGLGKARRGRQAVREKPLSTWEIAESVAAVLLLLAGLLRIATLSSLFLLLAAAVICPFRPLRRWLRHKGVPGWAPLALCALLLAAGAALWPRQAAVKKQEAGASPPPYIMLTWNEPGAYGEEFVEDAEADPPKTVIRFRLPAGRYRVLNTNSPNAATVTVHSDDEDQQPEVEELDAELEAEVEEAVLFRRNGAFTILGSKGQEISLDTDQYVTLSEKAEKVMFQYLGPLPVVEVVGENPDEEKEKEPDVYAYVNGKEVRMRRSPSVDAYIMTTFDTGKQVKVLGVDGDWTRVKVDNRLGYIFSKYLSETNPLEPEQTPAPTESPAPTETPAPAESPAPGESPAAEESPAPAGTSAA